MNYSEHGGRAIDCVIVDHDRCELVGKHHSPPLFGNRHPGTGICAAAGSAKLCNSRRCCALDFSRYLIIGMGHLLLFQAIAPLARADSPPTPSTAPPRAAAVTADPPLPWYIILNSPIDLNELLLRIKRPDLVIKAGQPGSEVEPNGATWQSSRFTAIGCEIGSGPRSD